MSEPTIDGQHLIEAWLLASDRVARAKRELVSYEVDLGVARRELAKWLTPVDGMAGEKIAVWFGDSLIQVTIGTIPHADSEISIRKRGRSVL